MTTEEAVEETTEVEKVVAWRQAALEQAGVATKYALRLAETDADLHVMLDIKGLGCDDETLWRIFR